MKSKLPQNLQAWFHEYLQLSTNIAATSALSQQISNGITSSVVAQSTSTNNESLFKFIQKSKLNASLFTSVDTILSELTTVKSLGNDQIELSRTLLSNILLFFRSTDSSVQILALEFLPNILSTYVIMFNQNSRQQSANQSQDQNANHLSILVTIFESFLLSMYNLCVQRWPNLSTPKTMRIPHMSEPTLYNSAYNTQQPPGLVTQSVSVPAGSNTSGNYTLGEMSPPLRLNGSSDNITNVIGSLTDMNISQPSFHSISRITGEKRGPLIRLLIGRFNQDIEKLSSRAHLALCQFVQQITSISVRADTASQQLIQRKRSPSFVSRKLTPSIIGGSSKEHPPVKSYRSPFVCEDLLVELTSAVYFIMFNGQPQKALESLNSIEQRASYEFISQVLLVVNGIKNSLVCNPSGAPADGPMGISVNLSQPLIGSMYIDIPSLTANTSEENAHAHTLVSSHSLDSKPKQGVAGPVSTSGAAARARFRSIITNASFKTMKLPDDIPIKASAGNQPHPPHIPRQGTASKLREETIPEIVGIDDVDVIVPSVSSSGGGKSFANKLRNLRKPGSKDSNISGATATTNTNGVPKESVQTDESSRFSVHSDN